MPPAPEIPHLPSPLREVASTAGTDVAVRLARHLGGQRLTIPAHRLTPRHLLVRTLGEKVAKVVAQVLGPGAVDIPKATAELRAHEARVLWSRGVTQREIAQRLQITQRHVRTLIRGVEPGERQAEPMAPPDFVCPSCGYRHRVRAPSKPEASLPLFDAANVKLK